MGVRAKSRAFRDLRVWEQAHRLALDTYRLTASFPSDERFGLTGQIRRALSSIPANIAEGCGRGGGDLARFCRIAAGSASELQYHLLLAHDLQFLDLESYDHLEQLTTGVQRMLSAFIDKLALTNGAAIENC